MDDKTLQALTALAAKLGTTADYLWGVLLRQAPITGVVDLLVCAGWIAGVVAWAKFVKRKTAKPARTDDDRFACADWSDEAGVGLAWASVFVAAGITALAVSSELSTIVAALANPEYWALRQILK
jgi:hypothetical protein